MAQPKYKEYGDMAWRIDSIACILIDVKCSMELENKIDMLNYYAVGLNAKETLINRWLSNNNQERVTKANMISTSDYYGGESTHHQNELNQLLEVERASFVAHSLWAQFGYFVLTM